jgi:hypothetical protein
LRCSNFSVFRNPTELSIRQPDSLLCELCQFRPDFQSRGFCKACGVTRDGVRKAPEKDAGRSDGPGWINNRRGFIFPTGSEQITQGSFANLLCTISGASARGSTMFFHLHVEKQSLLGHSRNASGLVVLCTKIGKAPAILTSKSSKA